MKESARLHLTTATTWLCRLLVGGVFLFSGFVKAIDPWGTIYKVNDYLAVMGLGLWDNLVLAGVMVLCIFEFLTGAFLATGSFRRAAPVMAMLMMLFMTPLTLWIAIKNPVADCGCFGDAYVISNWATFWKNIVISAATVWLLMNNRNARCIVSPPLQWLGFIADALFVGTVAVFGYFYQPLIDYRPYRIGEHLVEFSEEDTDYEPEYTFVYEKDGTKKEFSIDDELPDEADGWKFIERKEKNTAISQINEESGKRLTVWGQIDGEEENVTADVIARSGAQFILLMPEISQVSIASSYQINSLDAKAKNLDADFIAIAAGSQKDIDKWTDLSLARYPVYTTEDTSIKEIARGNPAIIYLEDGIVKWKSTLRALPTEDFLDPASEQDPSKFAYDNEALLRNITMLYVSVMAVVIILSFSPKLAAILFPRLNKKKADKEESERRIKA